ncbi:hypothetical protein ABE096_12425 [Robertmurraya massiliosenegalensis]|uniref:hypothetical protein n=1 Tax=Robertmurraya TaxID=2837507 RepID=UPI0039A73CE4
MEPETVNSNPTVENQDIISDFTPQVVVPVEIRDMTRFENEKGKINIIHEITIGDLLVSTSLIAILIFLVLSRIIRR